MDVNGAAPLVSEVSVEIGTFGLVSLPVVEDGSPSGESGLVSWQAKQVN